ncbi:Gag-pol fusion protein [Phytophthora palmivora]|uniref:Gag-pol fusion protein n=1 Tax=Phytophthora palmivora TaxID=4796 RepID=A0A2P4YUJ7_9STRA|nr:Gag-pol fusion protein [Phytophthora palmivora]
MVATLQQQQQNNHRFSNRRIPTRHRKIRFEELLTNEFTTSDQKEHLRDQLLRLRQNNLICLGDYVSAFRYIIGKVEDISNIDNVMHFRGLETGSDIQQLNPFQIPKVEGKALNIFVAELLKKCWVEVSDSSWVSNIFSVPKKDLATGKFPSEWLNSNYPHMPTRWIIDYRLVNTASDVDKIPLPHIELLFDRMEGAMVFSILDLACGYHQMRMPPTSKQYTSFKTNHEIYHWNVASMGLAGMPGTWMRLMRLMRKLLSRILFVAV